MTELLNSVITKEIDNVLKENQSLLIETLNDNLDPQEQISLNTATLCCNAIRFSSNISVKFVLEILMQSGVLRIDEEALKRFSLKVVK